MVCLRKVLKCGGSGGAIQVVRCARTRPCPHQSANPL